MCTGRSRVSCTVAKTNSLRLKKNVTICGVNQNIDSDSFALDSPINTSVEIFQIDSQVEYLPRNIADKFPNLKELWAGGRGLTVVRDHYFKDMQKLRFLLLHGNKIASIESKAFADLGSTEEVWLENNTITTLDRKLFITMINLKEIHLNNNKIKFLSSSTFKIPDGKLLYVDLRENVCIDKFYKSMMAALAADLRTQCNRRISSSSEQGSQVYGMRRS